MATFKENLNWGQAAESEIALWLRGRGYTVIPVYEKIIDSGKGPQVFTPESQIIAPDILLFKSGNFTWIEAKRKSAFSYFIKDKIYTTGIDLHHFNEYQRIKEHFQMDIWIMFYQMGGQAKNGPDRESPSGIYGNWLSSLVDNVHTTSKRPNTMAHSNSGMVYWSIDSLKKLAEIDDVRQYSTTQIPSFSTDRDCKLSYN